MSKETYAVVVLSIDHLRDDEVAQLHQLIEKGTHNIYLHQTGYLIRMTKHDDKKPAEALLFSGKLKQIVEWAYSEGYRAIDFEPDGTFYTDL